MGAVWYNEALYGTYDDANIGVCGVVHLCAVWDNEALYGTYVIDMLQYVVRYIWDVALGTL